MLEWFKSCFVSDNSPFPEIVGGVAYLYIFGVTPRIGALRAFTFGLRNYYFQSYPFPLSIRKSYIHKLNNTILNMRKGSYVVVIGEMGTGKSCLINTTLNNHYGVVKITAGKNIIDEVLHEITGIHSKSFLERSAKRMLFFYSLVFKRSPIVVIKVSERQEGDKYADMTSAVRALTDDYGLRVIVDGTPNSIPPELLSTMREIVITVEPMSREEIESIPELDGFVNLLKAHHLDDPVWKVLGGSPAAYLKLKAVLQVKLALSNIADYSIVDQVKNHIHSVLADAFNYNILNSSASTKQIVKLFREKKTIKIPKAKLIAMGFVLDYPNKVFLETKRSEGWYVEPSTPAVSLIISENIQSGVGVCELLEKLFKEANEKVK